MYVCECVYIAHCGAKDWKLCILKPKEILRIISALTNNVSAGFSFELCLQVMNKAKRSRENKAFPAHYCVSVRGSLPSQQEASGLMSLF